ncbi:MAG: hypothetical protein C4516_06270 [Oxalobacter sp.]|nr:MAG: hypothetical protein C4516_06270 [Oxalobacter sp.]
MAFNIAILNVKPYSLLRPLAVFILSISLLAACGQRGPLYLPEKGKPKKTKSSVARKAAAVNPNAPPQTTPGAVKPEKADAASPPVTDETATETVDDHNTDK